MSPGFAGASPSRQPSLYWLRCRRVATSTPSSARAESGPTLSEQALIAAAGAAENIAGGAQKALEFAAAIPRKTLEGAGLGNIGLYLGIAAGAAALFGLGYVLTQVRAVRGR